MDNKNYLEFIYPTSEINSLKEYANIPNSIISSFRKNIKELLSYKGDTKTTNLDRIWHKYDGIQQKKFDSDYQSLNLDVINQGTLLLIPKDKVSIEVLGITGKNIFSKATTFTGFWSNVLTDFINNPLNTPVEQINHLSRLNQNCSVWIWIRALNKIIDVSKFIIDLSSSVKEQGGEFDISLSPFNSTDEIITPNTNAVTNFTLGKNTNNLENIPFFSKYLQENDIVWIRYEQLESESVEQTTNNNLEVGYNQLPDNPNNPNNRRFYDMIGLIDDISESTDHSQNQSVISVSGRDFIKLLEDDVNVFFPLKYIENSANLFLNIDKSKNIFRRLAINGSYQYAFNRQLRSIKDTLGFIANQLINLGVVSNDIGLFSYYGDRISKVYRVSGANNEYLSTVATQGVWQIIDILVDDALTDRAVADSTFVKPDGPVLEQFNKICQQPFVEFFGDTYGDKYVFTARQPPFTQKAITRYLDENNIPIIEDYQSKTLSWDDRIYTWYQYTPRGAVFGVKSDLAMGYLPIITLPEYADIWGTKAMRIESNYSSLRGISGTTGKTNIEQFKNAAVEDLVYMLETTAYLPFTRRGTITIPYGDRRIKRGTFIKFAPTSEVFYVDAVTHNLSNTNGSVDRTTTLAVSRGMVEKYIKGAKVTNSVVETSILRENFNPDLNIVEVSNNFSYFDIVKTEAIRRNLTSTLTSPAGSVNAVLPKEQSTAYVSVDKDNFNFFLSRRQFDV